jgi:hypothetical protein
MAYQLCISQCENGAKYCWIWTYLGVVNSPTGVLDQWLSVDTGRNGATSVDFTLQLVNYIMRVTQNTVGTVFCNRSIWHDIDLGTLATLT